MLQVIIIASAKMPTTVLTIALLMLAVYCNSVNGTQTSTVQSTTATTQSPDTHTTQLTTKSATETTIFTQTTESISKTPSTSPSQPPTATDPQATTTPNPATTALYTTTTPSATTIYNPTATQTTTGPPTESTQNPTTATQTTTGPPTESTQNPTTATQTTMGQPTESTQNPTTATQTTTGPPTESTQNPTTTASQTTTGQPTPTKTLQTTTIQKTEPVTSTTQPPSTTTTPVSDTSLPKVTIGFVLMEVFISQLENPQSVEFKSLSAKVKKGCEVVYKNKFGSRFLWTNMIGFSRYVIARATENVKAELELVFNRSSTEPIPGVTEIVETLKEAALNPASGLNLSIDSSSITVMRSLQILPLSILTNGTFVAALSNSSSTEYRNRVSMIKTGLEPFFTADYPTSFTVISLRNFSDASGTSVSGVTIGNSMDLTFTANSTLPNSTQIVNTIVRAAKENSLPFKIFTHSIMVNGTAYSSAEVSSRTSVMTASILVALSLLVTWFD